MTVTNPGGVFWRAKVVAEAVIPASMDDFKASAATVPTPVPTVLSGTIADQVSLHTEAAEASGGGYTRAQTAYVANADGSMVGSLVDIPCAAGEYTKAGIRNAAGVLVATGPFTGGPIVMRSSGIIAVRVIVVPAPESEFPPYAIPSAVPTILGDTGS